MTPSTTTIKKGPLLPISPKKLEELRTFLKARE
jgi:hypothetical protein